MHRGENGRSENIFIIVCVKPFIVSEVVGFYLGWLLSSWPLR